jgi:hypothetical protein
LGLAECRRHNEHIQLLRFGSAHANLWDWSASLPRHKGSCFGNPIAREAAARAVRAGWRMAKEG